MKCTRTPLFVIIFLTAGLVSTTNPTTTLQNINSSTSPELPQPDVQQQSSDTEHDETSTVVPTKFIESDDQTHITDSPSNNTTANKTPGRNEHKGLRLDPATNKSDYRILLMKESVVEPTPPHWVWRVTVPFICGFAIFTIACVVAIHPPGPVCKIFK